MDQRRYSHIAHGNLPVWNPVGVGHLQAYVSQLPLPAEGSVLDIGCGRGFLLELILAQHEAQGIGVDASPFAVADAALAMPELLAAGRLSLVEKAFDAAEFKPATFDLVVCIGSTHAAGGYLRTLQIAMRLLRPRGLVLVGEGYWRRTPPAAYLAFLKMTAEEHMSHQENESTGQREGFELVSSSECSVDEWDAYEGQYARNVEDYARANPHDPDAAAMLERIRGWREAYLRWGRDTLGFGLYLFRKPAEDCMAAFL